MSLSAQFLQERLSAAERVETPFPYYMAPDFLPADMLRDLAGILRQFDAPSAARMGDKGHYSHRHSINLRSDGVMDNLPSRSPLRQVAEAFFDPVFMDFCVANFSGDSAFGSESAFRRRPYVGIVQFILDREGYRLGPHTDDVRKLMSLLFYLEDAPDPEQMGTVIYRRIAPLPDAALPDAVFGESGFEAVRTIPFRRGNAVAFARSERSFHGVRSVDPGTERLLCQFTIKHTETRTDL